MAKQVSKWIVMAPDGDSLSIPGPMGADAVKLKHLSFIYSQSLAEFYPQFFIPVYEEVADPEQVTMLLNEKAPEAPTPPAPPAPPTKTETEKPKRPKAGGRKKGTPNKPK